MKLATLLIAALLLSGCTVATLDEYQPVTDRPGPGYATDLAECRAIAMAAEADYRKRQSDEMAANLIGGLLVGALVGQAIGGTGDWTVYGAAHGAAAGAASTDTELAHGGPRRIVDRCLAGRGYAVLSDAGRG